MKLKPILFVLLLHVFGLTTIYGQSTSPLQKWDIDNSVSLSQPYPNPASQSTTLHFDLGIQQEGKVVLYNLLGTKIKTILLSQTSGEFSLPVENLQTGVYFIRLQLEGKELVTRKLKVMR